jgi:hypothetical protein
LGTWTTCPHPYVFPDLALYGAASLAGDGILVRQLAYGMVLGFLLWWFQADLMARLWDLKKSTARSYSAAGLLLLAPFLKAGDGLGALFAPGYHGGALLCAYAWLAWVVGKDGKRTSWPALAWAGGWVGLTWASDQITPAWVLAPGLALCLGLGGASRTRAVVSALWAFGFRFFFLAVWRAQGMRVAVFEWPYFFGHARALLAATGPQWMPGLSAAAWPLGMAVAALILLLVLRRERPVGPAFALALLFLGLSGVALSALQGTVQVRWFVAFVGMGAAWLPLVCSSVAEGRPWPLAAAGLLGLLWVGFFQAPAPEPPELIQARWLDTELAARGLSQGIADYGHARPLRMLSALSLGIAPAATEQGALLPFAWSSDRRVFDGAGRPQFVVLQGLDKEVVRKALGAPSGQIAGAGLDVWFYAPAASRGAKGRHA